MNAVVIFLFVLLNVTVESTGSIKNKYVGAYFWAGASLHTKIEDLDANLLTHVYYAFLGVENNGSLTVEFEEKGYVEPLANLKKTNPNLKVLFSCSNQNASFSRVVANETLRKYFVQNAYDLVKKYNYDGLDFDWEFPQDKDKEHYIKLLREVHSEFKKHDYIITTAVRQMPVYNNTGYIVPEMVKYVDLINIMTYDYYGAWSKHTGLNSPLYPASTDSPYEKKFLSVDASVANWVEAGASKNILNIGIPFYGRSFTLKYASEHGVHAPVLGGGRPASPAYYLILKDFQNYTTVWFEEQKSPYKYSNHQWLSYDDERSVAEKVKYAVRNDLAGVFLWHIGADDIYGKFSNRKQPLLQTINDSLYLEQENTISLF